MNYTPNCILAEMLIREYVAHNNHNGCITIDDLLNYFNSNLHPSTRDIVFDYILDNSADAQMIIGEVKSPVIDVVVNVVATPKKKGGMWQGNNYRATALRAGTRHQSVMMASTPEQAMIKAISALLTSFKEGSEIRVRHNGEYVSDNGCQCAFCLDMQVFNIFDGYDVSPASGVELIDEYIELCEEVAIILRRQCKVVEKDCYDELPSTFYPLRQMKRYKNFPDIEVVSFLDAMDVAEPAQSSLIISEKRVDVYTDASRGETVSGIGGVSIDGRFFSIELSNSIPCESYGIQYDESRAILNAIKFYWGTARHISINTDALNVKQDIGSRIAEGDKWQGTSNKRYNINLKKIVRLMRDYEKLGGTITLSWVKGHNGDLLNTLADKLSRSAHISEEKKERKGYQHLKIENICMSLKFIGDAKNIDTKPIDILTKKEIEVPEYKNQRWTELSMSH